MQQYGSQPMTTGGGKPWWMWAVVVLVVILLGVLAAWYLGYLSLPQPTPSAPSAGAPAAPLSGGDTAADVEKDLGTVDLGNVGQELDQLDADINQL